MDVRLIWLPFISDGMAPLLVTPSLAPITHILQIYDQTDGSYMGSSEMSSLYSIVNALTQTATTIILILTSLLPCSLVFPLPVCHLPPITSYRFSASDPVSVYATPTRSSNSLDFLYYSSFSSCLVNCTK